MRYFAQVPSSKGAAHAHEPAEQGTTSASAGRFTRARRATRNSVRRVTTPSVIRGTAIEVADTGDALLALAGWARRRLDATVVGVTGSVGKTTTKDMIAVACAAGRRTTANERSFNNDQGLPVTILNAPDDTDVLVLEMGMRGFGHIARLCEIARPDVGVVTVVGHAHTDLVGGLDGVARAKGELVEALPASGTAILNADDERVAAMAARTGASVVTYGWAGDVRPADIELDERARARFVVHTPWGRADVTLPVPGMHMVSNALAALAVAGTVGVDLDAAATALADVSVSGMRMEVLVTSSGATIVNDAYNANPVAMKAAVDHLIGIADGRPTVAVLGDMYELGQGAEAYHRAVGVHCREAGVRVVAVGDLARGYLTGAPGERWFAAVNECLAALPEVVPYGSAVLVKASRLMRMERVAEALAAEPATEKAVD